MIGPSGLLLVISPPPTYLFAVPVLVFFGELGELNFDVRNVMFSPLKMLWDNIEG
jgi:hypothetical protein